MIQFIRDKLLSKNDQEEYDRFLFKENIYKEFDKFETEII